MTGMADTKQQDKEEHLPTGRGEYLHAATGRMEPWPFDCDPPTGEENGWRLFVYRGQVERGDVVELIDSKTVTLARLDDPHPFGVVQKVSRGYCWVAGGTDPLREFYLSRRQALLMELGAIEKYLGLPRSVAPKHSK